MKPIKPMKKVKYLAAALLTAAALCTVNVYAEEATEYLFKFRNGADFPVSFLCEARLQSEESSLSSALGIYSTFDRELLLEYEEMGILEFFEENAPAYLFDMPSTSEYGTVLSSGGVPLGESYAQLDVDAFWQLGLTGKGLRIAVVDSGANPHNDIADNLMPGINTYVSDDEVAADPSLLYNTLDGNGHGTMVSGLIAANGAKYKGIAYEAKIIPIKAFSDGGNGNARTIAKGIIAAVDEFACDIINTSCGLLMDTSTVRTAVEYAYEAGVTIVAASGNVIDERYGTATVGTEDKKLYPACYETVISVGNIDRYNSLHGTSIENSFVDVVAPGKLITGLLNTNYSGYTVKTGTSFSCPIVSGIAALMLQANPSLTCDEVQSILQNTATDLGSVGYDISYGYGKVNCRAVVPRLLDGKIYRSGTVTYKDTYNVAVRNGLSDPYTGMLVFASYSGGKMTEIDTSENPLGYGQSSVVTVSSGKTAKLFEIDKKNFSLLSPVAVIE